MGLKALEIAGSSPKLGRDKIGTLQELPHFRMVAVLHLRVLSAEVFGFAQRVVRTSDVPHQFSGEQHEIGGNEFGSLSARAPGPRPDGLLACQH